ncbi:MAG: hypothetical protein NZ811_01790 [Gammaproteobacteria bacterium]|nr:hypothetical protein [Gammaproteobacteria bacterium]
MANDPYDPQWLKDHGEEANLAYNDVKGKDFDGTSAELQTFVSKIAKDNANPFIRSLGSRGGFTDPDTGKDVSLSGFLSSDPGFESALLNTNTNKDDVVRNIADITPAMAGYFGGIAGSDKISPKIQFKNPILKRLTAAGLSAGAADALYRTWVRKDKNPEEFKEALQGSAQLAATFAAFDAAIAGGGAAWKSNTGEKVRKSKFGQGTKRAVNKPANVFKYLASKTPGMVKTPTKFIARNALRLLGPWGLAASGLWVVGDMIYDSYQEAEANSDGKGVQSSEDYVKNLGIQNSKQSLSPTSLATMKRNFGGS